MSTSRVSSHNTRLRPLPGEKSAYLDLILIIFLFNYREQALDIITRLNEHFSEKIAGLKEYLINRIDVDF